MSNLARVDGDLRPVRIVGPVNARPGIGDLCVKVEMGGVPIACVTIKENSGFVLASLLQLLQNPGLMAQSGPMTPAAPTARTEVPTGHGGLAIAGSIAPARPAISGLIQAWIDDMARRGVKPNSVTAFKRSVLACAGFCSWSVAADVQHSSSAGWLAAKRKDGWSGSTHDNAVVHLASFSRFLFRHGHVESDRLLNLEKSGETGEPGTRALSLAEVRGLIRCAWHQQRVDRRAKGNRAFYWLFLALTGLRTEEAASIHWKDVDLAGEGGQPPAIYTDPKWAKNGKRQRVVLAPEVLRLLGEHRNTVAAGPLDKVFPIQPNRASFQADRDAAKIPQHDARGRPAGQHSLRKFLATILDQTGASPGVVSRLMRHADSLTQARYIDPPAEEEVAALGRIPALWPETVGVPQVAECPNQAAGVLQAPGCPPVVEDSLPKTVAMGNAVPYIREARPDTPMHATPTTSNATVPAGAACLPGDGLSGLATGEHGAGRQAAPVGITAVLQGASPAAVAGFLRGLADLLDGGPR